MSNQPKIEAKKEEKEPIPDQLNITIRTSIPGYQIIEYKPSMTIKDIDSRGVQFNPLIKLDKSKISKIPDEYRVKQFFNRGLFQSLLNYNGGTPARNLRYATRAGYVDNNIRVTLDTIFPVNSVIYIGKKPYAIGDVQWTLGNWKIDVKQKKEEIDLNKVTDPQLYSQLVKEEIISGEQQLNQLPEELRQGNTYTGPPPVARGPPIVAIPVVTPPAPAAPPAPAPAPATPVVPPVVPPPGGPPPGGPIVPINRQTRQDLPEVEMEDPMITRNIPLKNVSEQPPLAEEIDPREQAILDEFMNTISFAEPQPYHSRAARKRRDFRDFFMQSDFYDIANDIYKNFRPELREVLLNFYRQVTQPKGQAGTDNSIGRTMYDNLCNQFIFINPPSDGDCFFKAVSDGINIYNYGNELYKITYGNIYGKLQLFTIKILRDIVFRYYNSLTQEEKTELNIVARLNVNTLNTEFSNSIRNYPVYSDEEYIERLNDIYSTNDNFLVYKPTNRPLDIDKDDRPFRLLTPMEIKNYFYSKNYWGDEFAIKAICNVLGINIIPIEKVPDPDDKKRKKYRAVVTNIDEGNSNANGICSKKVLFLYRDSLHYELILFKYKYQRDVSRNIAQKRYRTESMYYTIFDSTQRERYNLNNTSTYPIPYHILILLYGSSYILIPKENEKKYIYKYLLREINNSVTKLIRNNEFVEKFDTIFNMQRTMRTSIVNYVDDAYVDEDEDEEDNENDKQLQVRGGQPPYRYPPPPYGYPPPPYGYPPPPYGYPPYQNRYITKKPEERDTSKIAYSITIDMEVHPGTSLTPEQINESKCNNKYNAIRKAYAEFTGKPYVIPPVYKTSQTKKKVGGRPNRITRRNH